MLDRQELITAIDSLATILDGKGVTSRIHIVGGAAIALTHDSTRTATRDVDAWVLSNHEHTQAVANAINTVADQRGWPTDWLNDSARIFIPENVASDPKYWSPLRVIGVVTTLVASAELLLIMKLRAARGRRDLPDATLLQRLCALNADEITELYDYHYPEDPLPDRARIWLEALRRDEG